MIDQQRAHTYGRDCWCNPLIVTADKKLLMPYAGRIVQYEPIGVDQMALHVEPSTKQEIPP